MAVATSSIVTKLRHLMKAKGLNVYVVPSGDAHNSEYVNPAFQRRAYISGFTGSYGVAVIAEDKALLWTDGRYWLQALKQLEQPPWQLMKYMATGVPNLEDWLKDLPPKTVVGIDPWLLTLDRYEVISKKLQKTEVELRFVPENLIDAVWNEDQDAHRRRPSPPHAVVKVHDVKYAGQKFEDKIKAVAEELKKKKKDAILLTALDETAWLFNLRGSDIDFNPVFFSYSVVYSDERAVLFIDDNKLTDEVKKHLGNKVEIRPYEAVAEELGKKQNKKLQWLVDGNCNYHLYDILQKNESAEVTSEVSIVMHKKSIKNDVEMEGMRQCHVRDGSALVRYLAWLEEELAKGTVINEAQGADQLEKFRSELDLFVSLSFDTISSAGANGAVIHYKPEHNDCEVIQKDGMYLVDSGGQYHDGTTDVTRTVSFGNPSAEQKEMWTLVLKGHIALHKAIFPLDAKGGSLDTFARAPLWAVGVDYQHGTGHGVGSFLCVHEGPQSISGNNPRAFEHGMKPGMAVSNEPGFYKDKHWGIRHENVVMVVKAKTKHSWDDKEFCTFENVTWTPYQAKMLDTSICTSEEIEWINWYHAETLKKVGPLLKGHDERAYKWLQEACKPISK